MYFSTVTAFKISSLPVEQIQIMENMERRTEEMAEVITILSRKGGSGKTTTAQSLAAALRIKGKRVLLVDLDAQMNLTASMNAKPTGYNITQVLEESATPGDAIQATENGDIIAASKFLAAADTVIENDNELIRALGPVLNQYDYIIIDTPATYGKLTRNALTASTAAIITAEAARYSLDGLAEVAELVKQIQNENPRLILRGVIVTKYTGRSNKAKDNLKELQEKAAALGTKIIGPPVRLTDKVIEAQDARRNLAEYAPKSTAAACYEEIADEIITTW